MELNLPVMLRLIIVVIIASVLLTFGLARNSSAIVPPCPVATDATIAQMAQQWAASFKTPYCAYLDERRNILLKQKLVAGVLQQTSVMSEIFRVTEESTSIVKRIEKVARRVNLKNQGVADMAAAKLRALKSGAGLITYSAGERAFAKASRVEKALERFSPTAFDFSSRYQAQKDAAKLAYLRGLVQAQELKLLSLLKMMDALEGER
jgi:hypothetical protein